MKAVVLIVGTFLAVGVHAQQSVIPDYDSARDDYFWPFVYVSGGETLYCDAAFRPTARLTFEHVEKINVEHVYSAGWIAEHHGCPNRGDGRSIWQHRTS